MCALKSTSVVCISIPDAYHYLIDSYRPYQLRNNNLAAAFDGAHGRAAQARDGCFLQRHGDDKHAPGRRSRGKEERDKEERGKEERGKEERDKDERARRRKTSGSPHTRSTPCQNMTSKPLCTITF